MASTPKSVKAELVLLMKRPENLYCADCRARGPTWASINLGLFVCMDCAGVHRSLGTHITQVRSTDLDAWQSKMVSFMSTVGNARANSYFEARMTSSRRLPQNPSEHERNEFIAAKYRDRLWYSVPVAGVPVPEPVSPVVIPDYSSPAAAAASPHTHAGGGYMHGATAAAHHAANAGLFAGMSVKPATPTTTATTVGGAATSNGAAANPYGKPATTVAPKGMTEAEKKKAAAAATLLARRTGASPWVKAGDVPPQPPAAAAAPEPDIMSAAVAAPQPIQQQQRQAPQPVAAAVNLLDFATPAPAPAPVQSVPLQVPNSGGGGGLFAGMTLAAAKPPAPASTSILDLELGPSSSQPAAAPNAASSSSSSGFSFISDAPAATEEVPSILPAPIRVTSGPTDLLTGLSVSSAAAAAEHLFVVQASPVKSPAPHGVQSPSHHAAARGNGVEADPFADLLTSDGKPIHTGNGESDEVIRRRARSSSNSRVCSTDGCPNPRVSRGLCAKHSAALNAANHASGGTGAAPAMDGGLGGLVDSMKGMEFGTPIKPPPPAHAPPATAATAAGWKPPPPATAPPPNARSAVSFLASPVMPANPSLHQYPISPEQSFSAASPAPSPAVYHHHANGNGTANGNWSSPATAPHAASTIADNSTGFDFMNAAPAAAPPAAAASSAGSEDMLAGLTISSSVSAHVAAEDSGSAFAFV